jgi:S-formylglutathione hydrolase FrmB
MMGEGRRTGSWCARLTTTVALSLLLLVAAPASASELKTFELPSRLVDTSTPGGDLEHGRMVPKVHVLLPDGYDADRSRGYPVVWLLHGAAGGTDTWIPAIKTLMKGFPGIIVMPDGGRYGMYTNWWNGGLRADPAWATYHLNLLRRTIDDRYPIRPGRRWHAVGGISMGGQGALRYGAMLPGYFGSIVGMSAAVPDMQSEDAQTGITLLASAGGADEGTTYDAMFGPSDGAYAAGNSPQVLAPNYAHTRIYLTSGNGVNCPQDPVNPSYPADTVIEQRVNAQQGPFAEAARAEGADVTDVTTCGVHTFGVWDRAFPASRAWGYFKPVPEHPRAWVYRTIATAGRMWGLGFRFTEPPTAVAEFERSGRTLAAVGSGTVRIRGRRGCRLTEELPFERELPTGCLPSS